MGRGRGDPGDSSIMAGCHWDVGETSAMVSQERRDALRVSILPNVLMGLEGVSGIEAEGAGSPQTSPGHSEFRQ